MSSSFFDKKLQRFARERQYDVGQGSLLEHPRSGRDNRASTHEALTVPRKLQYLVAHGHTQRRPSRAHVAEQGKALANGTAVQTQFIQPV